MVQAQAALRAKARTEIGNVARGAAFVVAGTAVWQASNFLLNAVASRLLGPAGYGNLAAVVGLVYISSPIFVSIQTVASRTTTSLMSGGRQDRVRGLMRFYGARIGFGSALVAAAVALASGPIAAALRVPSALPVAVVALAFPLSAITHLQRGVLQGGLRFARYGASSAIEGVAKVVAAIVLLRFVWPTEAGAVFAISVGAAAGVLCNAALLRFLPRSLEPVLAPVHPARYSAATLATMTLLAALLSLDILAAHRYLAPAAAGVFAAVSLCGKIVFFATSAVTAYLFPTFSRRQDRGLVTRTPLLAAMALVGAIAALIVTAYALRPSLVLAPLFGAQYSTAASSVPWMGLAFGFYAAAYLAAMFLLSQKRESGPAVLGTAVVCQMAGFFAFHASMTDLIRVDVVVFSSAAAILTLLGLRSARPIDARTT